MGVDYSRPVIYPDKKTERAIRAYYEQLTEPVGSLGRLEELGIRILACQEGCPPRDLDDCRAYVFAGGHGVTQGGVSAYPSEMSVQMPTNIETKGAGVDTIADIAGATATDVDISLDHDAEGPYHIRRSYGSIDREDATSEKGVNKAIRMGVAITGAAVDEGADLLIVDDLDIGNTIPAAALIGSMTNSEPATAIGRGTDIDDEGWKLRVAVVRDTMFRVRHLRNDPVEVLRRISSPDMTAIAVFSVQAAVRRTPVVLDGVVITSAALLADQLAPGTYD